MPHCTPPCLRDAQVGADCPRSAPHSPRLIAGLRPRCSLGGALAHPRECTSRGQEQQQVCMVQPWLTPHDPRAQCVDESPCPAIGLGPGSRNTRRVRSRGVPTAGESAPAEFDTACAHPRTWGRVQLGQGFGSIRNRDGSRMLVLGVGQTTTRERASWWLSKWYSNRWNRMDETGMRNPSVDYMMGSYQHAILVHHLRLWH